MGLNKTTVQNIRVAVVFNSQHIGLFIWKVMYSHHLKEYFLDQSIQKILLKMLKKEVLFCSTVF